MFGIITLLDLIKTFTPNLLEQTGVHVRMFQGSGMVICNWCRQWISSSNTVLFRDLFVEVEGDSNI